MKDQHIRVRFAPSPTGPLHIGGVRTALYNYLFAKQHGGDFLLRIEDTDQTRFVPGAEDYIMEAFQWLGLPFDEGVGVGGPHAPYRQSERKPLYKEYADRLIENGNAYYAFDTLEELNAVREACEANKKNFQYDLHTRMTMRNSLTMPPEEVKQRIENGEPYVIRFKFMPDVEIRFTDLIRGEVHFNSNILDDKVLYKSDGMPTYHLANVVDDHLMEITHVIRGEEWLPSCPLHISLYNALGWETTTPRFAHLPLLLKPDGNGKLSKRDGDRLGFPVFPLEWKDAQGNISSGYREKGYLPEAVINMLALLGWNPGNDEEMFSLQALIQAFSLDRISKSGAKFDVEKAKWFNHQYLQKRSDEEIADLVMPFLQSHGHHVSKNTLNTVVRLVKERMHFVSDFWDQASFFFEAPTGYDGKVVKKRWKPETPHILKQIIHALENISPFTAEELEPKLQGMIEQNQWNMGTVMNCLRLSLVGAGKGPHLYDIMEVIGKEETICRVNKAIEIVTAEQKA